MSISSSRVSRAGIARRLVATLAASVLLTVGVSAGVAHAADNPSSDFTWEVHGTNATITSYREIGGDVEIPATLTDGTGTYTTTEIGSFAFANDFIGSVTIPDSVTTIDDWAFSGNPLESVHIGDSVTSIGSNAFANTALTSVTIPASVTSIEEDAFVAPALTSVLFAGDAPATFTSGNSVGDPANVTVHYYPAASGFGYPLTTWEGYNTSVIYPLPTVTGLSPANGVRGGGTSFTITGTGFTGATGVDVGGEPATDVIVVSDTSITALAPAGDGYEDVTVLNPTGTSALAASDQFLYSDYAFTVSGGDATITLYSGAGGAVDIPATLTDGTGTYPVTEIGVNSFTTAGLTSVTIPDSVTTIDDFAFNGNFLASATLGDSVTSIGTAAFEFTSLTSVTIPDSVISIGADAFAYTRLTSVSLGDSVTSIGEGAFLLDKLTSVTIPDSVISIGPSAFSFNPLTSVSLGDSVATIGNQAFSATDLVSVDLPASVSSIDSIAFGNIGLTSVTFEGDAPATFNAVGSDNGGSLGAASGLTVYYSPTATGFTTPSWEGYTTGVAYPLPAVTALNVSDGPTAGSTTITITGTGFTGATAVKVGDNAATSVTVVSDTKITASTPAGTGTVHVTVATPGGTSTASVSDEFTYDAPTSYTVTFNPEGGDATTIETLAAGSTASDPGDPERSGYIFEGWFVAADGSTMYDFTTVPTADVTVYAHWVVVGTLGVTPSKHVLAPGGKVSLAIVGLTPREPFTVTLDGVTLASGTASKAGKATETVTLPKAAALGSAALTATGSTSHSVGVASVTVVASTKKLTFTLSPKSSVQSNRTLTIEVHGLTPGEKVTIDFRGKRVSKTSAVANSKGDYTVKVSAGWSWGYHTITATGASAGRHGSTRIDVVRRT